MARRSGARWYGGISSWKGPTGVAQREHVSWDDRYKALHLPEPVLLLAQAEYDIQFPGQPYKRMQERGGLGVLEIIALLADALERERAQSERNGQ